MVYNQEAFAEPGSQEELRWFWGRLILVTQALEAVQETQGRGWLGAGLHLEKQCWSSETNPLFIFFP